MNEMLAMQLGRKYEICPQCGSGRIGNGEGTVNVEGPTFIRTCKCGWKVEVHEDEADK